MKKNYQILQAGSLKTKIKRSLLGLAALCCINTLDAQVGEAISFDGVDDYVVIPDNSTLDFSNKYTFESWINIKAYQYGTFVAKYDDNGDNRGWMVNMGETGDNTKICVVHSQFGVWTRNTMPTLRRSCTTSTPGS